MIPAGKFLDFSLEQITPTAEEEFFTSLKLRNGTYKTTFQRRFTDIDHALLKFIESGDVAVDNVMDVGISSGSSTLELYQELHAAGYKSRITGTDMTPDAYFISVFPGCFALVDDTGYPLRYDILNRTMKPWVVSEDYRSGFFVIRKCINICLGRRAKRLMRQTDSMNVRKVKLITPRLRDCADITVQKDDITQYNGAFEDRFSFIRVANVLNKGYFTNEELASIIGNIRQYLARPRGALLVVRTHENGTNHGSLFVIYKDGECKVLQRFGQGSEIEHIVLGCMQGP